MRIIGGKFRGTRLSAPGAQGGGNAHLRPTSDRVREALFNMLAHGDYPDFEGVRVLDLFAGTGALGLEALSRGAARAVFIDDGPAARGLIRENIDRLGVIGRTKLWRRDATRLGPCRGDPFGLIFVDPPYGTDLGARALKSASDGGWIAPDAIAVLEMAASSDLPILPGLALTDDRTYGETRLLILQSAAQTPLGGDLAGG